jgi:RNA polymerase sigma-70 factor (ECF subfamily)
MPSSTPQEKNRSNEEEQQLIALASKGDHKAFQTLVETYQGRMFAVALQFARDRDRAEELVQETLVRAWTHLPRFQGGASFFTWVYRIMHNLNIDHHRRQQRRKTGEYDDSVGRAIVEHGVGHAGQPLEDGMTVTHRAELRDLISQGLEQISEDHRQILVLREIEELSYEEISEAIGIPKGTVMSRLFHARRKLLEVMQPMLEQEDIHVEG